jgi:polyphosphate kinase 2 (PPK2 family)
VKHPINQFEQLLADTGTTMVKIYLHISPEEQRQRLQSRLNDPSKNWKFEMADLDKRKQWADYRIAFNEALTQCNTPSAPWYVIPADQKWYRDLAITRILVHTLREMAPKYPVAKADWSHIVVE